MKIVGLCGGSGSGKGAVCLFFEKCGIPCIDTDKVYHDLVSKRTPCLIDLASAFGEHIISDNSLDRTALGEIVFSSRDSLQMLNSIAHRHILDEVRRMISVYERSGVIGVVVDAPLLFESGFNMECDLTVCVIADKDERIKRIMARDSIDEKKARARISSQIPDSELVAKCDHVIENNKNIEELELSVRALVKNIFGI